MCPLTTAESRFINRAIGEPFTPGHLSTQTSGGDGPSPNRTGRGTLNRVLTLILAFSALTLGWSDVALASGGSGGQTLDIAPEPSERLPKPYYWT